MPKTKPSPASLAQMKQTEEERKVRSMLAIAVRDGHGPRVIAELRAQLEAAHERGDVDRLAEKVAASAPRLTDEQKRRIRALMDGLTS